jgi:hypothetical protein
MHRGQCRAIEKAIRLSFETIWDWGKRFAFRFERCSFIRWWHA